MNRRTFTALDMITAILATAIICAWLATGAQ